MEINESDDSEETENSGPSALPPETFRAKGQTGLEQFSDDSDMPVENSLEHDT